MSALIITSVVLALIIALGVLEKQRNERNLKQLDIRVNVNGIRGKSTATRLITAVLWEAGYHAIGKTTGTAARMMFWDSPEEKEVVRKPRGVNISEQIQVIDEAVKYGADALVCECMAVRPEYQRVYQHDIIKAQITVIVNVLEDHLDEMGPTTEQIAWAFANTIPYNGIAVVPDCEFTKLFRRVARERNSKIFVTNDSEISDEYLAQFNYRLFDHNCEVALTTARALGISDEVAFRGMLKAHPDPGALRFYHLMSEDGPFCLVNAFAANEPASSLDIWNIISEENPDLAGNPIILMNCRPDRVDRTQQFIHDFFPRIPNSILITVGENTREVGKAYKRGMFPNVVQYLDFDGANADTILNAIAPLFANRIIMCVGNIHGCGGEPVLEAIIHYGQHDGEQPILKKRRQAGKLSPNSTESKEKELETV